MKTLPLAFAEYEKKTCLRFKKRTNEASYVQIFHVKGEIITIPRISIFLSIYLSVYIYLYLSIYVSIYICKYVYMYVSMYIYINLIRFFNDVSFLFCRF